MKLTHGEIAEFCRELAALTHSGIGLADGIFLLAEETEKSCPMLRTMGEQMDSGAALAEAMEKSDLFPGCAVGMVAVGEKTGNVEEVLTSLAQYYEQRSRSAYQIKTALTYPFLILLLMLLVLGVLLIRVLPIFDQVYASLGSAMTGIAGGLLRFGQLLEMALPVLLTALAAGAVCGLIVRYYPPAWEAAKRRWLRSFGDRGVSRRFNNANFARAVALGLHSALPLEDAVAAAEKLLEDIPGAVKRCEQCGRQLRQGAELSSAMGNAGFLPPAECRMLFIGLREGSAEQVMDGIARRLMLQAEDELEGLVMKVEPAMVLLCSLLVGMILLAVMLPLMDMMASLG